MAASKEQLATYLRWLDGNGVYYPKVCVKYIGPNRGYGLFAKEAISRNELIIHIPDTITLSVVNIRKIDPYGELLGKQSKLQPADEVVLFSIKERNNPKSQFKPYFDMITERTCTPLVSQSNIGVDNLPTVMRPLWQVERKRVDESFNYIKELYPKLTVPEFEFAYNAVHTRSYKSQGNLCIVPLADMANHATSPNTYQFRMDTSIPPLYTIMSARNIAKGEEITVSYGSLDNSLLWFMFGFHLDNNPNNQAGLPWTFLLDYMLKESLITPPVLAFIKHNPLNPVVFANMNGKVSEGFKENVKFLLTTADTVAGNPLATKEELDTRISNAIRKILRRFRASVVQKADTVVKDVEFLWRDDVRSIDAVLTALRV